MTFLADENVYVAIVETLRRKGYDVEHVLRTSPSISDTSVLAKAEGRVLLTFDRDFGGLVYGLGLTPSPRGVIYLRTGLAPPDAVAARVLALIENPAVQFSGWFTVVTMDAIRQRPMP